MAIEIRIAQTGEDLEAIFRFRYEISVQHPHYLLLLTHKDHEIKRVAEPFDCTAKIIGAFEDGKVVGTVRVNCARNSDCGFYTKWLGLECAREFHPFHTSITTKLMIEERFRGGTLAVRLAKEAFRLAQAERIEFDFIFCKPQLIRLFTSLGYRRYRQEVRHTVCGEFTPLVISLSDVQHLEQIRSPFAKMGRQVPVWKEPVKFFYSNMYTAAA